MTAEVAVMALFFHRTGNGYCPAQRNKVLKCSRKSSEMFSESWAKMAMATTNSGPFRLDCGPPQATDELLSAQRHNLGFAVVAIVFPREADLSIGEFDHAGVGGGNAVGIAAEIGKDVIGRREGQLGEDHPFGLAQGGEADAKASWVASPAMLAGKRSVPASRARWSCRRSWRVSCPTDKSHDC